MADYGSLRQHWNRVDLFKRGTSDETEVEVESASQPASAATSGTFISSGAIFEGTLSLRGDFHIDTEFRGELETDGMITIGPNGSVVGGITGREVLIQGAVVGDVRAPRQLVVEAGGKLHGNIETACLEIQKHAFFQGNTSMTLPQASRLNASAESTEPDAPELRTENAPLPSAP